MAEVLLHGGWEDGACILKGMDLDVSVEREQKRSQHAIMTSFSLQHDTALFCPHYYTGHQNTMSF